jgi:hypothetical protein
MLRGGGGFGGTIRSGEGAGRVGGTGGTGLPSCSKPKLSRASFTVWKLFAFLGGMPFTFASP